MLRTRFAPSPTGHLHLGHAASALFVWDWAERHGAEVILRIEDIDPVRCKPEFIADIYEDLHWLGLEWPRPVRRQSRQLSEYAALIEALAARRLVYRCFRTRSEISEDIAHAPHGRPVYLGPVAPLSENEEARRLSGGEPFSWRLSIAAAREALGEGVRDLHFIETGEENAGRAVPVDLEVMGDVILARKDTPTSYHLACTHDDAAQSVTHVIRGVDLQDSTHVHVLLQALMGWPTPVYHHHPLKSGPDGRRFAKRDKSQTLRALREGGMSAAEVRRLAAF